MAGLFSALNSATASLKTVQANLKLVSDNVARAEDPSRTRHSLTRTTDPTGGIIGVEYHRRTDVFLSAQLNLALANDSRSETTEAYLTRVGEALGTADGKPALVTAAEDFAEAWRTLQTTPESGPAANRVIQDGERMARELRRVAGEIDSIEKDIKTDIGNSVAELNRLLGELDRQNDDVIAIGQEGAVNNELLDRRDQSLRDISALIEVRAVTRTDGRVSLFTAGGLTVLDAAPVRFAYDGNQTVTMEHAPGLDIRKHLTGGKLGAQLDLVTDTSGRFPPLPPSQAPDIEMIRKLKEQFNGLAAALSGSSPAGQPASFADAYDQASPAAADELDGRFFIGNDRFTLQINPTLLDGTLKIKASAIEGAADAINASGRSFAATGIVIKDVGYTGMISGVMSQWTDAGHAAGETADQRRAFRELLEERFHGKVGINLDEEIAQLQELQTSYSASARVMSVANSMYDALERILG